MEKISVPSISMKDLVGGMMISFGILLFLTMLHIMAINEVGDTQSVLISTFGIFLKVAIAVATMVVVFTIIYFLRYLVYIITTPKWYREEQKNAK